MAKYLTDKAVFKCPFNMFKVQSAGQSKVTWRGGHVLTNSPTLVPVITPTCLQTPNAPMPCPRNFNWLPPFDATHTAAGKPLLLANSNCICLAKGMKVSLFEDLSNMPASFRQAPLFQARLDELLEKQAEKRAAEQAEKKQTEKEAHEQQQKSQQNQAVTVAPQAGPDSEVTEKKEEEKGAYLCASCSEACELKPYFKDRKEAREKVTFTDEQKTYRQRYLSTLEEKGKNKLLAAPQTLPESGQIPAGYTKEEYREEVKYLIDRHFGCKDGQDEYLEFLQNIVGKKNIDDLSDVSFRKNLEKLTKLTLEDETWSYQAHHLISVNQIMKAPKFQGKLLWAADVCGYDVNHGENIIMLLSADKKEDYVGPRLKKKKKLNEDAEKKDNRQLLSYQMMGDHRIQWHEGGHSYTVNLEDIPEENRDNQKIANQGKKIQNYIDAILNHALTQKIKAYITDNKDKLCPREFLIHMHSLSKMIKNSLGSFTNDFQSSSPFYVSKAALLFAFQQPYSFRLITVHRENGQVILKRVNCKIYKSGYRKMYESKDNLFKYTDENKEKVREKCAKFCNIDKFFVFFGKTGIRTLPFEIDAQYGLQATSGEDAKDDNIKQYIEDNMYELMRWQLNTKDDGLRPLEIIKKRKASKTS